MSDVIDCMTWDDRISNYERMTGFPRSMFVADDGRVVGTWIMGNDYRVKSEYYGGYPAGYLKRIRSMFQTNGASCICSVARSICLYSLETR